MTYSTAIQFLYDLQLFGTQLGLANVLKLAELAGHPQDKLRFIHVAGTNGKGSTCAMLESIYRAAGLRVGLFTSPHLVAFGERMQVNRHLISEADVVRLVEEFQAWLGTFPPETHPTFFEVVTVMALRYFAEQKCDLVILETGLGGRLDATNIVTPLASVITNIQFDHERWLGETLPKIAREKAGIIKPGKPVITATDSVDALEVIQRTAAEQQAPLTVVRPSDAQRPPLNSIRLPLLGAHQRLNAAVALATVRTLSGEIPVSGEAIQTGLETAQWAARLQVVKRSPQQTMVLDGAHNPAGAESLRVALQSCFPPTNRSLILGLLKDKDWETICRTLLPLADRVFLAPVDSARTASPEALAEVCRQAKPAATVVACASLAEALERTKDDPFVVITGSLHFIGEAMELLKLSPSLSTGERGLNEWSAGPPRH